MSVMENNFDQISFFKAFWLLGTDPYLHTNLEKKKKKKRCKAAVSRNPLLFQWIQTSPDKRKAGFAMHCEWKMLA